MAGILTNPKHEYFSRLVAEGQSHTEAAKLAGYSEKNAASLGSRLSKKVNISNRINELKERASEQAAASSGISKAWVIKGLRENFERAMQAEAFIDAEGNPTGEYKYQGQVANRALELMGKEIGMFIDRKEITVDDLRKLPTESILEMLSGLEYADAGTEETGTEDPVN